MSAVHADMLWQSHSRIRILLEMGRSKQQYLPDEDYDGGTPTTKGKKRVHRWTGMLTPTILLSFIS